MLDAQSALLRQAVESHAVLREEWRRSKERIMLGPDGGEEVTITLGEAHVLLELQVANQVGLRTCFTTLQDLLLVQFSMFAGFARRLCELNSSTPTRSLS